MAMVDQRRVADRREPPVARSWRRGSCRLPARDQLLHGAGERAVVEAINWRSDPYQVITTGN